jgi:hypothetical protein
MTRSGVEYDLSVSPYRLTTGNGYTFVFSSKVNRDKFDCKYNLHRIKLADSLSNRFKLNIRVDIIADFSLYRAIEKRGFLAYSNKGEEFTCPESMLFLGDCPTNWI